MKHKQKSTTLHQQYTTQEKKTTNKGKKSKNKRIVNWSQYNKALVRRGSISVYLSEAVVAQAQMTPVPTGTVGHPRQYADSLILFILSIRELFHLPLRQSIGLTQDILKLSGIIWQLPDYSTLSRRMSTLSVDFCHNFRSSNVVFLIDSSGFKVFGEGEWKVRKHGYGYRRTWRETHIAVDYATKTIIGLINTASNIHDNTQLKPLLEQVQQTQQAACVTTIIGDGAYDAKVSYQLARDHHLKLIVPPPKNATEHLNMYHYRLYDQPSWQERNEVVRRVDEIGINAWKQETGYHRRSLVENSFFRLKKLFGGNLKSRTEPAQYTEQCIRASLLNRFNEMGLPQYTN